VTTPSPRRRPGSLRPLIWAVAISVVALDQATKAWSLATLTHGSVRSLLPQLLQLRLVANTGAAFSMLSDSTMALALVSLLVSLVLLAWIQFRTPSGRWLALAAGLLLGGAIGNGIDRWRLGWVVDFLEFVPVRFPVFNIADVAINAAVLCLLIDQLRLSLKGGEADARGAGRSDG
jgi:signal peptidase II